VTCAIMLALKKTIGVRVSPEAEATGLDSLCTRRDRLQLRRVG
jgi:ammonia channel protein AmtB